MMKYKLFICFFLFTLQSISAEEESCQDSSDICDAETEYNAYVDCLKEYRRQKRQAGCSVNAASCEYVDCSSCQSCSNDGCDSNCRQCCTESCTDQLCCHKTCNNQCKTNYCRTGCRKECKQKIQALSEGNGIATNNFHSSSDTSTRNKHNITTVINLHNIINNTNLIDIPIKINNTNYNNITLMQEGDASVSGHTSDGGAGDPGGYNANRCCDVVGPRICNKIHHYPFMRCFHYKKHRCGPFCNAPVVHAQPQQVCQENACHNRMIYIPQPQPRCFHVPYWPFANCAGGQMSNCHGCYRHYTEKSHTPHHGCSRCYDDGFEMGPYYRQGPFYRPGFAHTPSCMQTGECGGGYGGMEMGGYGGMGMYGGYPMNMGMGMGMGNGMGMGMGMGMSPAMGMPYGGMPYGGMPYGDMPFGGLPGYENMFGPGMPAYSGAMAGYPVSNLGYPPGTYIDDGNKSNITVVQADEENKTELNLPDGINPTVEFSAEAAPRNSRYASIVIEGGDAPKNNNDIKAEEVEKKTEKVERKDRSKKDKRAEKTTTPKVVVATTPASKTKELEKQ